MRVRHVLGASFIALAASASLPAHALNIVIGNDDGCEASGVHALYQKLTEAGHQVIVSAPMLDQSGQGGALAFLRPITPLTAPSRGGNLPAGTPGVATLASVSDLPYGNRVFCVNSTPVAAVMHGLDVAAAAVFGAPADLVISGVNYGSNTGLINNGSGTVNAALSAVNRGYAAIAASAVLPASYRTFNVLRLSDQEYENADLVVALVARLERRAWPHGQGYGHGQAPARELIPAGFALNLNLPSYAAGSGGALKWRMSDEGTAAAAAPFFVADLSTSTLAQRVGLGNVHLPGVTLLLPGQPDPAATGLRFVEDNDRSSEQNVIDAGAIALSLIQGNHQAAARAKALMRVRLHGLVD
ncbi:MAG TPA: 5'/3'-nucleotidase SurE [Rubrivivax sp.]|nr:5'/3'-nucleotidase SurE [Rubrivivax sp.]HPO21190.1 5'/3'-nucleotidase SurE [Rubrivivax sp.]